MGTRFSHGEVWVAVNHSPDVAGPNAGLTVRFTDNPHVALKVLIVPASMIVP
jgi:hypothetical protein